MDLQDVTAVKNDGVDIFGIWIGTTFVWPDPWTDIWDEGTSVIYENVWHDSWSIAYVEAPAKESGNGH